MAVSRSGDTGASRGKAHRQGNFRRTVAYHACEPNAEGGVAHVLCGGPPEDHECVVHNGHCGFWDDGSVTPTARYIKRGGKLVAA